MITKAKVADAKLNKSIYIKGDDNSYQTMAINMLHGLGPASTRTLPIGVYRLNSDRFAYYNKKGPDKLAYSFYRPPGHPALLALVYKIFGNNGG